MKVGISVTALILIVAALTLYTSLEHHIILSTIYGPIAIVYTPSIAIFSFLLGSMISLLFQWGINAIQFEKVVKLLPEAEGRALKVLFDRRAVPQTELSSQTGLSRLMVHRIVSRLELRGIVVRKNSGSTRLIESNIYRNHPAAQALTRLPGISEKRLLFSITAVFLFGISLSLLNTYHVLTLDHPLESSLYLLAIEFFALGGLVNIAFKEKIASINLEKTIGILPEGEKRVLGEIILKKSITQKELVLRTAIPKMRMSRIIQKFEQRGIIEKKPYGYTNLIILRL